MNVQFYFKIYLFNSLKYLNKAKEISEKHNFQHEKYQTYIALAWTYFLRI